MDSYGEQGYFRGLLKYNRPLSIVLGGSERFPGIDVMRRNWNSTYKGKFPFYTNMPEIVDVAVTMVTQ